MFRHAGLVVLALISLLGFAGTLRTAVAQQTVLLDDPCALQPDASTSMSCQSGQAVLTASDGNTVHVHWTAPAEAGARYHFSSTVSTSAGSAMLENDARYVTPEGGSAPLNQRAPEGALVRVVVRGTVPDGSTLTVRSILLELLPAPPPEPTPTTEPSAKPTTNARPSPTASATPTPTPTPTPATPPVVRGLVNGDFEADPDLVGWSSRGGTASVRPGILGAGRSAVLTSDSDSTKYLQQTVSVVPGRWYEATAILEVGGAAEAGWVRIAWYASADGSGSQLSTADSSPMTGGPALASTGPVQAPAEARSATVRLMLRPLSSATAVLYADDASFLEVAAPPKPTPTPTPAAPATPTPSGPAPTAVPQAPSPPGGGGGSGTGPAPGLGLVGPPPSGSTAGGASLVRITEVVPNPTEPGRDTDWEWVELTNVGLEPASLAGVWLRDNAGPIEVPSLVLAPGASLVIAGPHAETGDAAVFRPAAGLGNGLGNSGDRLLLTDGNGAVLDALSYGDDATYAAAGPALLPAPGPGQSIERWFDPSGVLLGSRIAPRPSPGTMRVPDIEGAESGVVAPHAGPEEATEGTRTTVASGDSDQLGWIVALTFVVGGLTGMTAFRVLGGGSPNSS